MSRYQVIIQQFQWHVLTKKFAGDWLSVIAKTTVLECSGSGAECVNTKIKYQYNEVLHLVYLHMVFQIS